MMPTKDHSCAVEHDDEERHEHRCRAQRCVHPVAPLQRNGAEHAIGTVNAWFVAQPPRSLGRVIS
jgi:hypothetical protein